MSEIFEADCDQCGCGFPSSSPLWDGFDELHEEHDRLQGIFDTAGFHPVWHCSKTCQAERIAELKAAITEEFGPTCGCCPAEIGTKRMEPCHTCKKLTCKDCSVQAERTPGWWCSEDCKPTHERCKTCNREQLPGTENPCGNCKAIARIEARKNKPNPEV